MKDALGNPTTVEFDSYQYLPIHIKDVLGNTTSTEYDYRVLSPKLMTDPNGNRTAVAFDTLGIVVKSAVMGKAGKGEGDTLENPTAEMSYDFFNWMDHKEPNYIHSKVKEEHYNVTNVKNEDEDSWQESYEYSDGGGGVILAKVKTKEGKIGTDPSVVKRWIGNGRTVIDNKGNPIKQYEPYFSETHAYEPEAVLVGIGVTPILYYDAAGRNVRTVLPNDTFVKVEFDAWKTAEYDTNDTAKDSKWYTDIMASGTLEEKRAALLTEDHYNTPTISHTDCLGRTIYAESSDDGTQSISIAAFTQTDLAGRFSQIYDQIATDELFANGTGNYTIARNVSSYGLTNLLGQGVYNKTAVKGESWVFTDILGRMLRVWDNPNSATVADRKVFRSEYDVLHRPLKTFVQRGTNAEICVAKTIYGEFLPSIFPSTWNMGDVLTANLRGQAYQTFDQSGIMTTVNLDFKGNPLLMQRQLVQNYTTRIDWDAPQAMESDIFETSSTYDALNRPKLTILPDNTQLKPTYNKGAYLENLSAQIMGRGNWIDFLKGQDYDAKGQREYVKYGNSVITKFFYDAKTFRLKNLLTTHSNSDTLQDLQYTYDPVGNIMQVKDKAQSTFYYNNEAISPLKEYEYDALYRLKKATGREHISATYPTNQDLAHLSNMPHNSIANAVRNYTQDYKYDKAGNILQVKHQAGASGNWTRNYNYTLNDASNRLNSTEIVGGNTYLYNNYDRHGNMTKMPHLQALHWDYQDQLTEVELNGTGDTAYYNYDGGGQRVRKVVVKSGKKTERLYLGGVERYREYSTNNTVKLERWTVQIDDIAQVDTLTIDNSGSVVNPVPLIRYQYRDHLGSASLETNETGQVISYEEYHPFGTSAYRTARSGTDLSLKRYRFTNKERDDETGLYYFGVRYYAAWLGRWTSSDPGDFLDGLNMYVYVRNNPVNGVDELGYSTEDLVDPPVKKNASKEEGAAIDNSFEQGQEIIFKTNNSSSTLLNDEALQVFDAEYKIPYNMGQLRGKSAIIGETTGNSFYLREYIHGKMDYQLIDDEKNIHRLTIKIEEGYKGSSTSSASHAPYRQMVDSVRYVSMKTSYHIDISVDENGQITMTDPINSGGHESAIITSNTNPTGHNSRYNYKKIDIPSKMETDELLDTYSMLLDGADRLSAVLEVDPEWNPYSGSLTPEILDAIAGVQAAASHQGGTDPITRVLSAQLTRLYYAGIIGLLSGNAYRKYGNHSGRGYSILEWGGTKQNIKVHRK